MSLVKFYQVNNWEYGWRVFNNIVCKLEMTLLTVCMKNSDVFNAIFQISTWIYDSVVFICKIPIFYPSYFTNS